MYRRILVPYDGSETSSNGLDEAIRLARLCGARIRLLHVIDVLLFANGFETAATYSSDIVPFIKHAGEKVLLEGKSRAEKAGVPVDTVLVDSIAVRLSDVVNDQVQRWEADVVVIGTHGRRGVGRFLMGSDAEQILRSVTVPVLLVRAPQAVAAPSVASGTKPGAA